jgi:hypothetical protein
MGVKAQTTSLNIILNLILVSRQPLVSASISIARPSASITVAPPSGYIGSTWCNQNGVTFTATPIGCFSKYEWYFPSGWTGPNGEVVPYAVTSGNTVVLKPSADAADAGAITVKVYLDCGKVLTSSAYNVTYTPPTTYVSGNALACSGNTTYTVVNAPSGTTASWSSSNTSLLSISSSTGVGTRQGTGHGSVTITANILGGCRSMSVSKSVWVGKPRVNSITGPDAMFHGQSDLFVNASSGGSTYSWLTPSGWTVQSPSNFSTWITVGGTTSWHL